MVRITQLVLAFCLAYWAVEASATSLVDQSFLGSSVGGALADGFAFSGQTVTAGTSGFLVQVELDAGRASGFLTPWNLAIEQVANGLPHGVILSLTTIAPQNFPIGMTFPDPPLQLDVMLSTPVFFSHGDQFAIVLYPQGATGIPRLLAGSWEGGTGYAGGTAIVSTDGTNFSNESFDFDFRTLVNNAVPEPSSVALAAFGFVGLAAWGWRRRKRFPFAH